MAVTNLLKANLVIVREISYDVRFDLVSFPSGLVHLKESLPNPSGAKVN